MCPQKTICDMNVSRHNHMNQHCCSFHEEKLLQVTPLRLFLCTPKRYSTVNGMVHCNQYLKLFIGRSIDLMWTILDFVLGPKSVFRRIISHWNGNLIDPCRVRQWIVTVSVTCHMSHCVFGNPFSNVMEVGKVGIMTLTFWNCHHSSIIMLNESTQDSDSSFRYSVATQRKQWLLKARIKSQQCEQKWKLSLLRKFVRNSICRPPTRISFG